MGVGLGNGVVFWYWARPLSLFSTSSSLSTLLACLRFSRIWKKSSGLLYSCLNILDNIKWGAIRNFCFVGKDSDKAVNQQILAREGIKQKESSKLQMFKVTQQTSVLFLAGLSGASKSTYSSWLSVRSFTLCSSGWRKCPDLTEGCGCRSQGFWCMCSVTGNEKLTFLYKLLEYLENYPVLSVKSLGLPANWPEVLVILPQLSANLPGSITDLFESLVNLPQWLANGFKV